MSHFFSRAARSEQRAASSALDWIPFLVGSVVLAAALFKIQRLWTDSSSASGVFESTWFQAFLVAAELACGFALWLRVWPRVVRWAGMLMFAGFFGAALSQGLGGARSCACFGNVQLHPWFAVLLDVGMLASLFYWKPKRGESANSAFFAGPYAASIPIGVLVVFPVGFVAFGRSVAYPRLEVFPATVDLGAIPQGARIDFAVRVRNPHANKVAIHLVDTTCPCLKSHALPWLLNPREEKTVELTLDLAREPQFVGGLVVEMQAVTTAGTTGFVARIEVAIVPSRSYVGLSP